MPFDEVPTDRKKFVGLVGCGKAKRRVACSARSMYVGALTKLAISWMGRNCEKFFILSAKFGLLSPSTRIEPYNLKMSDLNQSERTTWGQNVRKALPLGRFLILAGKDYVSALGLVDAIILCDGMNMFERMAWLRKNPILPDTIS